MIKIICDVGSNHNNDLGRAKQLIKEASNAGCYGVKFQLFKGDKLFTPDALTDEVISQELNPEWIPELLKCCRENVVKFGITPFHLEAVEQASPWVDFFKISSFDILRKDLIQKCLQRDKPLFISMGLATKGDIHNVFDWVYNDNGRKLTDIIFMHCISSYPTPLKDVCMNRIIDLKTLYGHVVDIGYSDHTGEGVALISAIANGATWLELHCDLDDGQGSEFKHGHCWKVEDIASFIGMIREVNETTKQEFRLGDKQLFRRTNPNTGLREHP